MEFTDNDTVILTMKEYDKFNEAYKQLNHLINNGVDNWDGYSHYSWDEEGEKE